MPDNSTQNKLHTWWNYTQGDQAIFSLSRVPHNAHIYRSLLLSSAATLQVPNQHIWDHSIQLNSHKTAIHPQLLAQKGAFPVVSQAIRRKTLFANTFVSSFLASCSPSACPSSLTPTTTSFLQHSCRTHIHTKSTSSRISGTSFSLYNSHPSSPDHKKQTNKHYELQWTLSFL